MIGRVLYWRAAQRMRTIARRGNDAGAIQRDLLLRFLRRAAATRFGRDHDFASIGSLDGYRERVPVHDYETLRPYLDRVRDGAEDELWPGLPESFAVTAGTTGGEKYLPHTERSLASHLAGATDALGAYLVRARDKHLLCARIAFFGGSVALGSFESGIRWGDNTGLVAGRTPGWVHRYRSPSQAVLAIEDWEERLTATARELARCDVRLLMGVPSWVLVLLDAVEQEAGRPIRDVWPSWRGFLHGGIAFAPYAETYRKRVGRGVVFVETYTATEAGVIAVQDRADDDSMALLVDRDVFFEFIPAHEPESPRLTVDEVEENVPYILCVTTAAGLWSYRIGDVVRFAGTKPLRLVFHGREDFFLNAFGERVSQGELERAVAVAATEHGCEVREFAVLPEYPDVRRSSGRHVWMVEFERPPDDVAAFASSLDDAVRKGNFDYGSHRTGDCQLLPPEVRVLHRNSFFDWMKERGLPIGLHPVPRILDKTQAEALTVTSSRRRNP